MTVKERGYAEQMIEEAMVLANVCVANYLNQHKFPGVYRVHEKPDPEKVETLYQIARVFNVPFEVSINDVNALEIEQFLSSIDDETAHEVLSRRAAGHAESPLRCRLYRTFRLLSMNTVTLRRRSAAIRILSFTECFAATVSRKQRQAAAGQGSEQSPRTGCPYF